MRCFACDIPVENGYDKKTDRFYCDPCFEPTNQVILKKLDEEMDGLFGMPLLLSELSLLEDEMVFQEVSVSEEDADGQG